MIKYILPTILFAHLPLLAMTDSNSNSIKPDAMGYCLYSAKSQKKMNLKILGKHISASNVVYVGEKHDQIKDHLAQLKALELLYPAKGKKIAVGFEMLNVTLQPILDDYAKGDISEDEFLEKANWEKEWGFDFNLYKPLFDFIREKKLKALALNIPKKIVAKIARIGLEGLMPEDRKFLPENIHIPTDTKYLNFLKTSFGEHGDSPMSEMFTWENYLVSMSAWNEAMGAKMADFLNKNKEYSGLVIAGNGHIIYNAGIPFSVKTRTKNLKHSSFYTEDAFTCPEKPDKEIFEYADFIWFINHKD
ncbi:MAG: ChaN family lipoprotein [Elusimicrobia bacterium]|nr:ChaN family lipoprotein [Elusimicrobiota bacterium]